MHQFRAEEPGTLPKAGRPVVGGVRLPPGRPQSAAPDSDPDGHPLIWVTDDVMPRTGDLVQALRESFRETGLWPVTLQALGTDPDDGRPWLTGEYWPSESGDVDAIEPVTSLCDSWYDWLDQMYEFGDYMGVVEQFGVDFTFVGQVRGPLDFSRLADFNPPGRVGLVPVTRPADVPDAIGWTWATNYMSSSDLSAVLRSWEDRFGAVLVRLGDYVNVWIPDGPDGRPTPPEAAIEHFSMCPDELWQNVYTMEEYLERFDHHDWYCWWD
jgi:hypothetical protein